MSHLHDTAATPQMAVITSGRILLAVAGALLLCAACAMVLGLRRRPHSRGKQHCRRPAMRSPTRAAEAARQQEREGKFRARMAQLRQDGLVSCGRVIEQPTFAGMFDLTTALETCHEETEYEGYDSWYEGGDSWMRSEVAAHGSFSASSKESPSRVCSAPSTPSPGVGMDGDAPRVPAKRGRCNVMRGRVRPAEESESASAVYSRSL